MILFRLLSFSDAVVLGNCGSSGGCGVCVCVYTCVCVCLCVSDTELMMVFENVFKWTCNTDTHILSPSLSL